MTWRLARCLRDSFFIAFGFSLLVSLHGTEALPVTHSHTGRLGGAVSGARVSLFTPIELIYEKENACMADESILILHDFERLIQRASKIDWGKIRVTHRH